MTLDTWVEECHRESPQKCVVFLVGNKIDMEGREVSYEEGKDFADRHKM